MKKTAAKMLNLAAEIDRELKAHPYLTHTGIDLKRVSEDLKGIAEGLKGNPCKCNKGASKREPLPDVKELASQFEAAFGGVAFLKLCLTSLNRLLVDKGIVTKDELNEYFRTLLNVRAKQEAR